MAFFPAAHDVPRTTGHGGNIRQWHLLPQQTGQALKLWLAAVPYAI